MEGQVAQGEMESLPLPATVPLEGEGATVEAVEVAVIAPTLLAEAAGATVAMEWNLRYLAIRAESAQVATPGNTVHRGLVVMVVAYRSTGQVLHALYECIYLHVLLHIDKHSRVEAIKTPCKSSDCDSGIMARSAMSKKTNPGVFALLFMACPSCQPVPL